MGKNIKKISVVIPIYNVEKYLSKCIESVENQKRDNIEVILVNDGSTDKTEEIIRKYEGMYQNIKYIKKQNGGLSEARNYGVKEATGDYICFIDSDDYISDSLFSDLEPFIAQDYDLIKYKTIKVNKYGDEIERVNGPVFENKTGEDSFNILYSKDVMIQPAWLYLYKKSFWDENKFEYPVGMTHEDFARTVLIMLKAKKVVSTDIYGYYYVQSDSSITRGNDENKIFSRAMDLLNHYDYMIQRIEDYDIKAITKENIKIYYTNCIILKLEELSKQNKKIYLKEIRKRKMYSNIKVRNIRQLIKKILLSINIDLYLKWR